MTDISSDKVNLQKKDVITKRTMEILHTQIEKLQNTAKEKGIDIKKVREKAKAARQSSEEEEETKIDTLCWTLPMPPKNHFGNIQ